MLPSSLQLSSRAYDIAYIEAWVQFQITFIPFCASFKGFCGLLW